MNAPTQRGLIWTVIIGAFVAVVAGGIGTWKRDEAGAASPSAQSIAPSAADAGMRQTPELPSDAAPTAAATPANAEADALSLDDLASRLQRANALEHEALLIFKTAKDYAAFLRGAAGSGLVIADKLEDLRSVRVRFDSLERLQAELRRQGVDPEEIGANYLVSVPRLPAPEEGRTGGDVPFGDTVLSALGINAQADRSKWGRGVTVAVVDSGVGEHPAFRVDQVAHVDLVNDGQPFDGHGTAIASLIAGNTTGAQGVAPGANLLDVRVADGSGNSNSFLLARGITTAVNRGARVINVSMGSYGDASVVQEAVARAQQRGVIVIAAAGNEQAATLAWPAAYPNVISVTGVDANGQLAYFSNSGNPTLAAPGVGIPSAYWRQNKAYLATGSGTSQSTALVSGAAAYILGNGGNVPLTLTRNAQRLQVPAQQVGAGMLRVR